MDDLSRSTESYRGGFRKFIVDPKSSVMSYLAENMAAQQLNQQQQSPGANGPLQNNSQHYNNTPSNGPPNSFQSQSSTPQGSLTPSQIDQTGGRVPSPSVKPGNPLPSFSPYVASNLGPNAGQVSGEYASGLPVQNQDPFRHHQSFSSRLHEHIDNGISDALSMTHLGKVPPIPGSTRRASPHSAPRLYSRMVLDFEAKKNDFLAASARK